MFGAQQLSEGADVPEGRLQIVRDGLPEALQALVDAREALGRADALVVVDEGALGDDGLRGAPAGAPA